VEGAGRFAIGLRRAYIPPAMEFLNVLAIKKIAYRKGCTAERTATIKHRHYVQIFDAKGRAIDGARRGVGFGLLEAKRLLEAMPDRRTIRRKAI
jgi:ribosomal protein L7/L12